MKTKNQTAETEIRRGNADHRRGYPGPRQFQRVEEVMQGDPVLSKFLANKTHIVKTDSVEPRNYSPEAVLIAQVLYEQKPDVKRALKEDVLRVAVALIEEEKIPITGTSLPVPASAAAVAPSKSSGEEEKIEIAHGASKGIYIVHPIARMFPVIKGLAYDDLFKSIQQDGQQEPCVMDGNTFLDGRNRVKILNELGRPTQVIQIADLKTNLTPAAWVWTKNQQRRHLTNDQYLATAAKYLAWQKEQSERQKAKADDGTVPAQDSTADRGAHEKTETNQSQGAEESNPSEYPQESAENRGKRKRGRPSGTRSEAKALAKQAKQSRYRAEQMLQLQKKAPELATAVEEGHLSLKEAMQQLKAKQSSGKDCPQHTNGLSAVEKAVGKAQRLLIKAASELQSDERICCWQRGVDFASREAQAEKKEDKQEATNPKPDA